MKEIEGTMIYQSYFDVLEKNAQALNMKVNYSMRGKLVSCIINYSMTGKTLYFDNTNMEDTVVLLTFNSLEHAIKRCLNQYCWQAFRMTIDEYWER